MDGCIQQAKKAWPTALLAGGLCLFTTASALALPITNGSFESGLVGWTVAGSTTTTPSASTPPATSTGSPSDASAQSSLPGLPSGPTTDVNPTDGALFAYLTNAGPDITATQLSQTFTIPTGVSFITFDWRFMTSEIDTDDPPTNDAFQATLSPQLGSPMVLETRDDLQPGGSGALQPGATAGVGGYSAGTAWNTTQIDLSSFAGQTATISFEVYDVTDSVGDSAVALDNVRVTTPEPGTFGLAAAGVAVLGLCLRRRSRN